MLDRQVLASPVPGGFRLGGCLTRWLVWLVMAAASAAGLRHYEIDNDLSEWMPHLRAVGPVTSYVVIGYDLGTIDGRHLAGRLRSLSTVAFCIDPATVEAGGWQAGVTTDEFVIGPDRTYEGIFVFRQASATDAELVGQIEALLAELGDQGSRRVSLGGPAVFHIALNRACQRRLPAITLLVIALGGGLLWWITGRAAAAWAAVAAITLSQVVLVGVISWLHLPMDLSLSMAPPMMMCLGFSYAAHRVLRRGVTGLLAVCAATTALGIGSFVCAGVAPIRTFAVAGVFGLGLVWMAVITLVPKPPLEEQAGSPGGRRLSWLLHANLRLVEQRPRTVLIAGMAMTLAALAVAPHLRLETNPLNYFPRTDRVVRDFHTLNQRLTGMLGSQVTVSGEADPTALIRSTPGVRKVIDISQLVGDGRHHYWCLADNEALPALITLENSLGRWAEANQVDLQWCGVAAQLSEVSRAMARTAVVALPAMGAVAAIVIGLLARSATLALISAWVNLLPVGALVLLVTLVHWYLGLPALMIGAIAVGMAIDDTVHLTMGLRRTASTVRTLAECWRPCTGSTLVAAACLACFALSPFGPTRQFGVLLAVAALAALLADLLLLPAVWQLVHQRKSVVFRARRRAASP